MCYHYQGSDKDQHDKTSFIELEVPVGTERIPCCSFHGLTHSNLQLWYTSYKEVSSEAMKPTRVAGTECCLLPAGTVRNCVLWHVDTKEQGH